MVFKMNNLPEPSADAKETSAKLLEHIKKIIEENDNWIPFSHFMEMALYTPNLGYYSGGSHKIGVEGDFITAPSLTPLFGQTLAKQLVQLLPETSGNIYEFGAGRGDLAVTLIQSLPSETWQKYYIIELSGELVARQKQLILEKCPDLANRVIHLDRLPETFDGIIIGNELLDAIPCELIEWNEQAAYQKGVSIQNDELTWQNKPINTPELSELTQSVNPSALPYTSEIHLAMRQFLNTISSRLSKGGLLMIDYGFDEYEYYHPQRDMGTLIGHYRHHSVHNPFFYPGLMDLTCHINFSSVAEVCTNNDLIITGYTTQANFLLNLGLLNNLAQTGDIGSNDYIKASSNAQMLIAPHEMGELFKVIGFAKNITFDWDGFRQGDMCHKL